MAAPTVKFYQFTSSGVDPAGSRHLTTHPSFIKQLGASSSGILDFGTINIDSTPESPTKAVLFRVSALNGISQINNLRFWGPALPTPQ